MLVSVAAYALIWGWKFAVGFVALLFVHEMGHVIQLRRECIKSSAPVFIPFMGAAVWSKSLGNNAVAEARVGLAGPILGSIGAAACIPIASATANDFWKALAFTGFFLNLFNLLPVVPLDGGRAMAAMSPWMWALGLFGIVVLAFTYPNPIILLIALLAVMETWRRWRALKSGDPGVRSYYRVRPAHRVLVAAVYLGLTALVARLDRLALVEAVLAARERDLDLRAGAGEVDPRRHEREAALVDAPDQPLDLALVGEQLARALGLVVLPARRPIRRDVDVVQPQLAVADARVAVLELGLARAQRLHLGALEHDAGLELVEELVAVGGVAVRRHVARRRLALLAGLRHEVSVVAGGYG